MRKTRSVVLFVMLLAVVVPSHGDIGTEGFSIQYLDQGWSPELRRQFYHTAQGTKLIPYDWFVNLTMNDGTLFKDTATRPRYGFLPNPYPANEHKLPIGFTGDPGGMLGLNCAACHTSQIRYRGKTVYIDGGASMQDNLAFMQEMSKALVATLENDKRRKDFALKVHMQEGQVMQEIKKALEKMQPVLKVRKECQDPEKKQVYNNPDYSVYPMDGWGFGRLDALGRGGNTVLTELLNEPCGLEKADAPVSIPSLWDAWKYDWVQWNGSIENTLARNIGQAVGLNVNPDHVDIQALDRLESYVQDLKPPRWKDVFRKGKIFGEEGQIDQRKAQKGKELYHVGSDYYGSNGKGLCAHCHEPKVQQSACDGKEEWVMTMVPLKEINTDGQTATNFADRKVKTGMPVATIMEKTTGEIMEKQFSELKLSMNEQDRMQRCRKNTWRGRPEYKAPSHAGVWATPPYLHNGSVRNLYQLLLPAKNREPSFCVGRLEFDPKHVGFTNECAEGEVPFDTAHPGNSNTGHEFKGDCQTFIKRGKDPGVLGCELKEEDRWAIIEYLKTL